ncbi:VOC family protein [Motilibacter aurantiacus]|uniref:VOC family protein n=1 Tax=Motilibacter aurantiacus TaxID=2714955 RepID=UPI00140D30D0|nr:VOC family protein [Motilibacter aurantiacus]NHC44954.1 VOC family protein [Motilibacter aurantiacus]
MPTRDTAWPPGTPCWVDYGAADLEAAKEFYAELLGWAYTGGEAEFGGYLDCRRGGRAAAGMGPQQDPSGPPTWTTYFATEDAAAACARVTSAGGTVLAGPVAIADLGAMAVALDPQGSVFGLWQAGRHIGAEIVNEPGSLVWNEAAVDDPVAAREFYTSVFGFGWEEVDELPGYATFAMDDGRPLGGLGGLTAGSPKGWATCFSVASADAAIAVAERRGATVTYPAEDTSFGRFAVLQDPWGASFCVMSEITGG